MVVGLDRGCRAARGVLGGHDESGCRAARGAACELELVAGRAGELVAAAGKVGRMAAGA